MEESEDLAEIVQRIERLVNKQNAKTGEPLKGDKKLGTKEMESLVCDFLDMLGEDVKKQGIEIFIPNGLLETKKGVELKGVYRHFKGKLYYVHDVVIDSETREDMVLYQPLYPPYSNFVRSKSMFLESIDPKREGNVTGQSQRFERYDPS